MTVFKFSRKDESRVKALLQRTEISAHEMMNLFKQSMTERKTSSARINWIEKQVKIQIQKQNDNS